MPALGEIDIDLVEDERNSVVVVVVAGEVDLVTAPRLRDSLTSALNRDGVTLLVVDLDGVSFLDSTGLSALATTTRRAAERDQVVRLCCLQPMVLRVLTVTGLAEQWALYETREQACNGLGS